MRSRLAAVCAALPLVVTLAACSSDDDDAQPTATESVSVAPSDDDDATDTGEPDEETPSLGVPTTPSDDYTGPEAWPGPNDEPSETNEGDTRPDRSSNIPVTRNDDPSRIRINVDRNNDLEAEGAPSSRTDEPTRIPINLPVPVPRDPEPTGVEATEQLTAAPITKQPNPAPRPNPGTPGNPGTPVVPVPQPQPTVPVEPQPTVTQIPVPVDPQPTNPGEPGPTTPPPAPVDRIEPQFRNQMVVFEMRGSDQADIFAANRDDSDVIGYAEDNAIFVATPLPGGHWLRIEGSGQGGYIEFESGVTVVRYIEILDPAL